MCPLELRGTKPILGEGTAPVSIAPSLIRYCVTAFAVALRASLTATALFSLAF